MGPNADLTVANSFDAERPDEEHVGSGEASEGFSGGPVVCTSLADRFVPGMHEWIADAVFIVESLDALPSAGFRASAESAEWEPLYARLRSHCVLHVRKSQPRQVFISQTVDPDALKLGARVYWRGWADAARALSESADRLLGASSAVATRPAEQEQAARERERVVAALNSPNWDFRTVDGIARDTGLSEDVVRRVLEELGGDVRGPVVPDPAGREMYTLASRPPSRREKWLRLRALLTRSLA